MNNSANCKTLNYPRGNIDKNTPTYGTNFKHLHFHQSLLQEAKTHSQTEYENPQFTQKFVFLLRFFFQKF